MCDGVGQRHRPQQATLFGAGEGGRGGERIAVSSTSHHGDGPSHGERCFLNVLCQQSPQMAKATKKRETML